MNRQDVQVVEGESRIVDDWDNAVCRSCLEQRELEEHKAWQCQQQAELELRQQERDQMDKKALRKYFEEMHSLKQTKK